MSESACLWDVGGDGIDDGGGPVVWLLSLSSSGLWAPSLGGSGGGSGGLIPSTSSDGGSKSCNGSGTSEELHFDFGWLKRVGNKRIECCLKIKKSSRVCLLKRVW